MQKNPKLFRKFWHRRAARKSLQAAEKEKRLDQSFTIKRVRVILDTSLAIERQFFNDLAKTFGIPPVNISVFSFKSKHEIEKEYADFFDPEEIDFFGRFEGDLALLCEKEVDLQINYFNREDLYMGWISTSAKKKITVGFSGVDKRLNDLIFEIEPTDKELFQKELVKYLKILKKL